MSATTALKRAMETAWYRRGRLPVLRTPIPWRLPYGAWWLAHPDGMGARVVGYRFSRHPYEEPQWLLISRLLQPGMTFVDVGANQGFHTLLASKRVGVAGRVVAFEPASTEVAKLRRNLSLNGATNVEVVASAVGETDGETTFTLCLDHQGSWSSIVPPAEDVTVKRVEVMVPILRLDTYAERHGIHPDVIKIDVEGGELAVLRGASEVLRRDQPVILCEIEDRRTRQWGYGAEQILEYISGLGYNWYSVGRDGTLRPCGNLAEDSWQNLVAVPANHPTALAGGEPAC